MKTDASDPRWESSDPKDQSQSRSILLLDKIQDPQNLGAILRTAFFLGVEHIVLSSKKTAPVSETVSRVSSGALELLIASERILEVKGSMTEFVEGLGERGWHTVGTEVPDKATIRAGSLSAIQGNRALILGNEETGVRPEVLAACSSGSVTIPRGMASSDELGLVDSLNVSAAAAILLHDLVGKASPP
mmetsp:Transcript_11857/g.21141  ORF Transcript_11857/g.21141 Transcript_11857/m.21141 type:complete len:189 (+) Transcript_11857:1622-2188(+)